jgi:AcrR family transcriptional regulator
MTAEPIKSTVGGTGPSRRQRSDAQQNVVALLAAAKTDFAASGVDAPAKEITDLAGVGVGTLYRHFPRRSDLIIAVLQHEIDECVEAAEQLGSTLGPWEALTGWVGRFTDFVGPNADSPMRCTPGTRPTTTSRSASWIGSNRRCAHFSPEPGRAGTRATT